jgi:hypothetical protein
VKGHEAAADWVQAAMEGFVSACLHQPSLVGIARATERYTQAIDWCKWPARPSSL